MDAALRASVNLADLPIRALAAVENSSVGPTNCIKMFTHHICMLLWSQLFHKPMFLSHIGIELARGSTHHDTLLQDLCLVGHKLATLVS